MNRHVAVVMGGPSAEREVSLTTGREVALALEGRGYRVSRVDAAKDLAERLRELEPDVVFNALHGRYGEDGTVQGLLEIMGLPYTHSGVLASALAIDKPMAIRLFRSVGLQCPEGVVTTPQAVLAGGVMPVPYVVKPTAEGSSVGVFIIKEEADLDRIRQLNRWAFGERVLVERYIAGRELTVVILDDKPLAVTEIRPYEGFYDYRAKYTDNQAEHVIPASLPEPVYEAAMDMALRAHAVLGCRDLTRADLRYDDSGDPSGLFLLEVNTQPGMTPLSLAPEQAAYAGIGFGELVGHLVEAAWRR
ncbi:D-alanine--D-alanine ligase [Marinivivus vitaminiproducens]|uniref:D-alanine--D-alanine ligase n=1 Tax=Marinivivus vitaminiproducens TaxID=3035935 RepID=UPI00279EAA41|nr:D-alanine--D-alanine ligase [Geminicoccaceae bacterium SCSIO 64248]